MLLFISGEANPYVNAPPAMRAAKAAAVSELLADFPGLLQWRDWIFATHWVPEGGAGASGRSGAGRKSE
jgi:hypothetical protein